VVASLVSSDKRCVFQFFVDDGIFVTAGIKIVAAAASGMREAENEA